MRILRPGGRAAVVYNERDERDPFTGEYGALVRRCQTDDTEKRRLEAQAAFEAFEGWHSPRRLRFRNEHVLDSAGILARTLSTSYLPKVGSAADELREEVHGLFARHARNAVVTLAMQTIVIIGDVGGDGG